MSPVVRHGLHDAPVPRAASSVPHQPEQHAGPAGDTADARLPLPGLLLPLLTTADGDLVAARKQDRHRQGSVSARLHSVPARHISEGAAPCPYCLAPCPIIQHPARIFFFFFTIFNSCFCVFRQGCKNACKMLADLCPCFHRSPTKLCSDLVSFMYWIATEFWSFAL